MVTVKMRRRVVRVRRVRGVRSVRAVRLRMGAEAAAAACQRTVAHPNPDDHIKQSVSYTIYNSRMVGLDQFL